MNSYEFWTLIILAVTTLIFLIQIGVAVRSFTLDHQRRKEEATINYMNTIRPQYRELNNELVSKLGEGTINEKKIEKILKNKILHAKIKDILGLFEHLAVGANAGVFDIKLLNKMSGIYLITIHDRYLLYFTRRRKDSKNPRLYEEFSNLVETLKTIRKKETRP